MGKAGKNHTVLVYKTWGDGHRMIPSLQTDMLACLLVMDFARTHQIL